MGTIRRPTTAALLCGMFLASWTIAPEALLAQKAQYNPATDPLVNAKSLFEPAHPDGVAVAEDETFFFNLDGNPASLNPLFETSTYEFRVAGTLFEGLFTFDAEMRFMVNKSVVESFEESEDHTVYTVKMKPGLKWHDGHPFTAHDVAFSYKQIMDERVPCPAVRSGTDEIAECVALDDLTVKIVHKKALPTSCWNALFPIIPKHLYEKDKENNPDLKSGDIYNRLNRSPVGNGPFRFVEWRENDKIVVERWEDYAGDKPYVRRIVFRIIPDANILLLSFCRQDIDEFRMTAKQFATQTDTKSSFAKVGYKLMKPQWSYSYICWNMNGSNPFFNDVRVRRAMTHACDIQRMIRDIGYSLVNPCHGMFHPDSWMFNPEVKLLEYDLDKAEELLDAAGWRIDEEREGWRHKVIAGEPVRFQFTMLIPQGSKTGREVSAIFQEDLRSIGVEMKTRLMEWATFSEATRKHEFQASMAAWGTGVDPDTNWNLWRSDQYDDEGKFGRNYGGYSNARVDELFELARHEFDQKKRRTYYQELTKIVYDEQPYTFLWNRNVLWGLHKRIRGITTGPRGVFNFSPAENAWWVKDGEQKYPAAERP